MGMVGAAAAGLTAIGLYVQESLFQLTARTTMAVVESVHGTNDRCGSKRNRHNCTEFDATLRYTAGETVPVRYTLEVSAGSARGSDQPSSLADLHRGDEVEILYDPDNPEESCLNSWGDIHTNSMMGFGFCAASLFMGFAPQRRRAY